MPPVNMKQHFFKTTHAFCSLLVLLSQCKAPFLDLHKRSSNMILQGLDNFVGRQRHGGNTLSEDCVYGEHMWRMCDSAVHGGPG